MGSIICCPPKKLNGGSLITTECVLPPENIFSEEDIASDIYNEYYDDIVKWYYMRNDMGLENPTLKDLERWFRGHCIESFSCNVLKIIYKKIKKNITDNSKI